MEYKQKDWYLNSRKALHIKLLKEQMKERGL